MKYINKVVTIILVLSCIFLVGCSQPVEISWKDVGMNENGSKGNLIIGYVKETIDGINVTKEILINKSETIINETLGNDYFWQDNGSIINIETNEDVTKELTTAILPIITTIENES